MSDNNSTRYRFTVPTADTEVIDWINAQLNLGFSLRVLIKSFIQNYGIQDATCLGFTTIPSQKKRGRPLKEQGLIHNVPAANDSLMNMVNEGINNNNFPGTDENGFVDPDDL